MTVFDYAIIAVVLISAVIGIIRGFIRETLSLVSWVLALWAAFVFAKPVSALYVDMIDHQAVRAAAGFVTVFVPTLLLLSMGGYLLRKLLVGRSVKGTDRVLGGLFGTARALLIVAGFMLLAGVTNLPNEKWWRESLFATQLQPLVVVLRDLLPADIAKHLKASARPARSYFVASFPWVHSGARRRLNLSS